MHVFNIHVIPGATKYQEDEKTPTSKGLALVLEGMVILAENGIVAETILLTKLAEALKVRERELERLKDELANNGRVWIGGFRYWVEMEQRFQIDDLLYPPLNVEDPKTVELIG